MIIGVVVLAIIVGVVVVASSQRHGAPTPGSTGVPEGTPHAPAPAPEPVPPPGANGLDEALGRWLGASLVTADQADAIRAFEVDLARRPAPPAPTPSEHAPHGRPGRVPVAAEALGYLGGSLIMAGMVLIVGHAWPHLALGAKLALTGVAAAALVAGGALVPAAKDPAFERIRSFLWLASSAATAVFAVVVARDGFDAESAQTVALVASATVAIESGALWRGRVRPAQQAPALIAALVAVGSMVAVATDANDVAMGLAVWLASAAMAATGLRHRFSTPLLTAGIGAIGLLVGAVITASDNGGGGGVANLAQAPHLVVLRTGPRLAGRAGSTA